MSGYSISDALAHRDRAAASRPEPPPRRRRRRVWIVVLSLLAAGSGPLAARYLRDDPNTYASPETAAMPPLPDHLGPTRDYIAGDGGLLITGLLEAADQALREGEGMRSCEIAIDTLDGLGSPQEVFAAAQGLPDAAGAEIAVRHASALTTFLGTCVTQDTVPAPDELTFTSTILRRRLDALE